MLLTEVREVAALANSTEPQSVSQRTFDSARASSADHADLPAARQIARELKLKWPEVLAVAHTPESEQNKLLALKARENTPHGWLTNERIKYVLRLVAGHLRVDTLAKVAYDEERDVLLNEDARDWLHGRRLRLPSANAIGRAVGGWDEALRIAGLKELKRGTRTIHQVVLSRVEAMERFHEYHNQQPPSQMALEAFARGNKIPMRGQNGQQWPDTVAEWRKLRADAGLSAPRIVKYRRGPGVKGPDWSVDVGAARLGEYPVLGKWSDKNVCADWVARYLATLQRDERSTARAYQAWVRKNHGAPDLDRFVQHGGWDKVRRKAQKRLKAQGAARMPPPGRVR
ncbi:MAG: hypothetical protein WBV77_09010 [Solirubrobacteraceae bacterium]